jgi:hypothetical protein
MTFLLHLCQWLAGTAVGTDIRESDNLFSIIETVHVLGIIVVAGTIAIVDLRILGLALGQYPVREVLAPLVNVTWVGFLIMAATGFLLFWSEADKLFFNWAFRIKVMLLLAAGLNQWRFQRRYKRIIPDWDTAPAPPRGARLAAVMSLGLWFGIIVTGRAIAYL